jgi:hypothetical protein
MAEVTFIIPEKDNERVELLRTLPGVQAVRVAHKPFDPRSDDAELQSFEESLLTISYDAATLTESQDERNAPRGRHSRARHPEGGVRNRLRIAAVVDRRIDRTDRQHWRGSGSIHASRSSPPPLSCEN